MSNCISTLICFIGVAVKPAGTIRDWAWSIFLGLA